MRSRARFCDRFDRRAERKRTDEKNRQARGSQLSRYVCDEFFCFFVCLHRSCVDPCEFRKRHRFDAMHKHTDKCRTLPVRPYNRLYDANAAVRLCTNTHTNTEKPIISTSNLAECSSSGQNVPPHRPACPFRFRRSFWRCHIECANHLIPMLMNVCVCASPAAVGNKICVHCNREWAERRNDRRDRPNRWGLACTHARTHARGMRSPINMHYIFA